VMSCEIIQQIISKSWPTTLGILLTMRSELPIVFARLNMHGDIFAVFDHYGDIRPIHTGEEGLYYDGTRFLSSLMLDLDGLRIDSARRQRSTYRYTHEP
jgi:hypothetical protein